MEIMRCAWVPSDKQDYIDYHDNEWGMPVHDDFKHFEMLVLEGAQAGLSWYTVLRKREGYRQAFYGFDPARVAQMSDMELEKIIANGNVVRNRLKIFSARRNALAFLEIQKSIGSFNEYVWSFVGGKTLTNRPTCIKNVPARTEESDILSKDLKKRGMNFVGSTIIYAYMQATGLVDDHLEGCFKCTKPEC